MGNIHTQVTEPLLQEVFASTGPVENCKLIRKEKVGFSLVLGGRPFLWAYLHWCVLTVGVVWHALFLLNSLGT